MRINRSFIRYLASIVAVVLLVAPTAFGQGQTGNIFGKVVDSQKAALPGVTVTLSGIGASQVFVTDSEGLFRFLSLSPGTYALTADLSGFGKVVRDNVSVNIGRNTSVELELTPQITDTIIVTVDAPLLDVRKTGTGATVTNVELDEVPTARDPWVILQQVPGVLMDRINVGGNMSGQQSQYVSKGSVGDQSTFNVDGVNITDMAATGSSTSYYDFGSFQEIQVATGGTDPRVMTPGAQINMVTKRGTNTLSGAARIYYSDHGMQSTASIPTEAQGYLGAVNEIDRNQEYGLDIGGPIVKDRLWIWGAYAKQNVDLFVAAPTGQTERFTDKTELETYNFKLNAQLTASNSAVATWSNNQKVKLGRDAAPDRPPATTFNQSQFGPKGIWKVEDTQIFTPNFYLTGLYSKIPGGGFQLQPDGGKGCMDTACGMTLENPWVSTDGSWNRSFLGEAITRPQKEYRVDGSYFFDTGGANHELKFGFGYRQTEASTLVYWPGNQFTVFDELVHIFRWGDAPWKTTYDNGYVGDTILYGNLTAQIGARYDKQKQESLDSYAMANDEFPDILPSVNASGSIYGEMSWNDISPRVGLTYAIGPQQKTLVRAAYNKYVDQMGGNSTFAGNNFSTAYSYLYYYFTDANGDHHAQPSEIDFSYLLYAYGVNPTDPSLPVVQTRYGPNASAPNTDEFILGVEHELLPEFTVGLTYTHREMNDFLWRRYEKTQGSNDFYTTADYVLAGTYTDTLPDGTTHSVPYYAVKDGEPMPFYNVIMNRDGYSQTYDGLELTAVKRLSNRWMLRGNFSWNDWTQSVSAAGIVDPTQALTTANGCTTCDGSTVAFGSGTTSGSFRGVYINSKWSYVLTGLYTVPVIETNVGFNLTGRQGYPLPYFHQSDYIATEGGRKNVLINGVDGNRLANPFTLDLRLSKEFRFGGAGLEVSLDAFNVTNEQTILQRELRLFRGGDVRPDANNIRELVSPQIFRLGARITF